MHINESERFKKLQAEKLLADSKSCLTCIKNDVCFLYRNEIAMMSQNFGHLPTEKWPNYPHERATKCKSYVYGVLYAEEDSEKVGL